VIIGEEISMNIVFMLTNYVLKQQGLAISGKYCLYDQNDNPLLYIEEKVNFGLYKYASVYMISAMIILAMRAS
jgi:hypothetical protein